MPALTIVANMSAWEMLFDCFKLRDGGGESVSILISDGAMICKTVLEVMV